MSPQASNRPAMYTPCRVPLPWKIALLTCFGAYSTFRVISATIPSKEIVQALHASCTRTAFMTRHLILHGELKSDATWEINEILTVRCSSLPFNDKCFEVVQQKSLSIMPLQRSTDAVDMQQLTTRKEVENSDSNGMTTYCSFAHARVD